MFRIVSFSLTLVDQTEKDSFFDAVEYNTYIPILCGPWCIYPIFRQDRIKPRERVRFCQSFQKIYKFILVVTDRIGHQNRENFIDICVYRVLSPCVPLSISQCRSAHTKGPKFDSAGRCSSRRRSTLFK